MTEEEKCIRYAYSVARIERVPLTAVFMEMQAECGYDFHLEGVGGSKRITSAEKELIEASMGLRRVVGSIFGPGINQHHGAFEAWQRFEVAELTVRKEREALR